MKRYGIILLIMIVLLSVGMNFYQYGEMKQAEAQLTVVNNRVLDNIEQYARWSIRFMDEIQGAKEAGEPHDFTTQTAFSHLQNSLEDLVEYYAYFVDLRREDFEEEGVCTETLESLRSIRNVVNHSLQDKFEMNQHRFTANDYLFLQELEILMEGFLANMYRISDANENQLVIEIPREEGENLWEVATNLRELGSRYRHSRLGEPEETWLSQEQARTYLLELGENWVNSEDLEEAEIDGIHHRNGISHYALETEDLLLWLDAELGTLRYVEYTPGEIGKNNREIDRREALDIAREFYQRFQESKDEELEEEIFVFTQEDNGETVYAFRFTPVDNGIRLSSDAFEVSVLGGRGEVIRYRNRYDDTAIPVEVRSNLAMLEIDSLKEDEIPLSAEGLVEMHQENFPTMEYQGRAVIRNYYTEFYPRLVKVFFEDIEGQRAALYFDEYTGLELERLYYPYEPF